MGWAPMTRFSLEAIPLPSRPYATTFRRYKNAEMASQVSVWGSPAQCTDQLAEITEAGAEMVMLNPTFDHLEQLNVLAEEVMPHL